MSGIDEQAQELYERAQAAADNALAPYSGFRVGAALLCADGTVVPGCNVENAAYSMTICAERTALVAAVAAGHREFRAIAVHVDGPDGSPCGACRQVIAELGGPDLPVTYVRGGSLVTRAAAELLPDAFDAAALT
jgi:cytidine deaminase